MLDRLTRLRDNCLADMRRGIEALAQGDLTREITPVTAPITRISGDEIGSVAIAVNDIRGHTVATIDAYHETRGALASLIGEVSASADTMLTASQQMASTSGEPGRAVDEIARAIGDVAGGAERQVRSIASARQLVERVAAATSESSSSARDTAGAAQDARRIAEVGAEAAREATDQMAAVREASEEATGAIGELGAKSNQIGSIVDTITAIAEQTDLLALNAAIEAARAGEQRRGFAVVAEEVRKLAEEFQHAAQSIASLIGDIQGETMRAVEAVETGGRRTAEGAATVAEAREGFERIASSIADVSSRIDLIVQSTTEIAANSGRVQGEVGELAAVAEQTSASSEQVSAATQQTSASAQQIAASSQELAATADELAGRGGRFRLTAA